jgi:mannose-6-phosphate isomerase-like protein (cupin superfamily)/ABC-type transporter Mla MlaB component
MPTARPHEVAFSIRGPIARADLPGLCHRVCTILGRSGSVASCDVSGVEPDAVCVDALARLQLAARRRGCCVRLENASGALLDLVELMGLTHVLPAEGSQPRVSVPRVGWKTSSMANYTHTNLADVEDAAVKGGFSAMQEARFANDDLDLETLGVSYQVVKPGKHHAFGHRHKEAEEVYVVLSGSGTIRLDDDEVQVGRLDAIRVGPEITRGFAADSDGLELLVFSQKTPGDAEIVEDFFEKAAAR